MVFDRLYRIASYGVVLCPHCWSLKRSKRLKIHTNVDANSRARSNYIGGYIKSFGWASHVAEVEKVAGMNFSRLQHVVATWLRLASNFLHVCAQESKSQDSVDICGSHVVAEVDSTCTLTFGIAVPVAC